MYGTGMGLPGQNFDFADFHCSYPQRKSRTYEICRAITTFTKSHGYLMNLEVVKKCVSIITGF